MVHGRAEQLRTAHYLFLASEDEIVQRIRVFLTEPNGGGR
jgi:hypothetical protein